jgi:flagellar biosynthesis protein FliR
VSAGDNSDRDRDKDTGWFDDPKNVNKVVRTLIALCIASVVADLFYDKHTHYGFQGLIGFDAIYGFVSCVLLVLAAKQLRKVLMRDEDYYD